MLDPSMITRPVKIIGNESRNETGDANYVAALHAPLQLSLLRFRFRLFLMNLTDGRTDGRMDGRRRTDGRTDVRTYIRTYVRTYGRTYVRTYVRTSLVLGKPDFYNQIKLLTIHNSLKDYPQRKQPSSLVYPSLLS